MTDTLSLKLPRLCGSSFSMYCLPVRAFSSWDTTTVTIYDNRTKKVLYIFLVLYACLNLFSISNGVPILIPSCLCPFWERSAKRVNLKPRYWYEIHTWYSTLFFQAAWGTPVVYNSSIINSIWCQHHQNVLQSPERSYGPQQTRPYTCGTTCVRLWLE